MWFEIKENGEVVKATMKDEKIINVPDTYKSISKKYIYVGIGLILIGTISIIYDIKKKK